MGNSPHDISPINGLVPDPEKENKDRKLAIKRSLDYMIKPNTKFLILELIKFLLVAALTEE